MNMSSMDTSMQGRDEQEYGRPYPNAPQERSRFAFLIGKWRCEARLKREDGVWETLQATWVGRYVLDGYVIMDEYRMTRPTGELLVLGMNLRSYDVKRKTWSMKWLNALGGTWVEGTQETIGEPGTHLSPSLSPDERERAV